MKFDRLYKQIINEFVDLTKKVYKATFTFPAGFHTVKGGVKDINVMYPAEDLRDALRIAMLFSFSGFETDENNEPLVITNSKLAQQAEREAINWYQDYNDESTMEDIVSSSLEGHEADLDNFSDDPESVPGYFIDEDTEVYLREIFTNSNTKDVSDSSTTTYQDLKDKNFKKNLGRF
jgi:hypothetical protein